MLLPREAVLCIAEAADGDLLFQLALVLASGGQAVWIDSPARRQLAADLPDDLCARVAWASDVRSAHCSAVIVHAGEGQIADIGRELAQRDGPIVGMLACTPGQRAPATLSLERLYTERTLSVNTAAAGGNASLMTIG
jgi:RHH-type proline utilization regulon transcriptional repressor/proline dehydrogenase/delta 1-pyrroline-5-carboxylate dehydrogenase